MSSWNNTDTKSGTKSNDRLSIFEGKKLRLNINDKTIDKS